ncbi:regulatory protein TetR [Actinoplanes friuliensis DSM 7358]|uniref:Regulatory protein TetR n=2 Tax=Actinoplanes friuliensis TaxID=196914 RepID=U5WEE0_9ACTN|nr:regulatory protein TetR [Actinoplanes friuliensis DSM 7358]
MSAATHIIAAQGLGAATATIAKEAGVSNGSLFTYFDTKSHLINELYFALKSDMSAAACSDVPTDADPHGQLLAMWSGWLRWAAGNPEKRRALAQLQVSDEISAATHEAASRSLGGIAEVLDLSRKNGPMRDATLAFVLTLVSALSEATIDFIHQDPANADTHARAGFDALWRMLS